LGNKVFGNKVFGNKVLGNKVFGDKVFADKVFVNKVFVNKIGNLSVEELQEIYRKVFSYPGPIVRVFVRTGYFDVAYVGSPKWVAYLEPNVQLSSEFRGWMEKLKELRKSGIDNENKRRIDVMLSRWNASVLSNKSHNRLPVLQWVNRRMISEKGISELSDLYWNVKLKMIQEELLK
jgi:hypothetical protein